MFVRVSGQASLAFPARYGKSAVTRSGSDIEGGGRGRHHPGAAGAPGRRGSPAHPDAGPPAGHRGAGRPPAAHLVFRRAPMKGWPRWSWPGPTFASTTRSTSWPTGWLGCIAVTAAAAGAARRRHHPHRLRPAGCHCSRARRRAADRPGGPGKRRPVCGGRAGTPQGRSPRVNGGSSSRRIRISALCSRPAGRRRPRSC